VGILSAHSIRPLSIAQLVALLCTGCAVLNGAPSGRQATPAQRANAGASLDMRSRAQFAHLVDSLAGLQQVRRAQFGLLVVEPERGETVFARNADLLFVPASNQKLVTAAVSLATLGPEFRFATRVALRGVVRDSVLVGDLIVIGSGDPSFSDRMRGDAMIPLRDMADSLRAHGVRAINGSLRRGPHVFTDAPLGAGWAWEDIGAAYGAPVGELMYNETFGSARVVVDGAPLPTADRAQRSTSTGAVSQPANFLEAFGAALSQRGVTVDSGVAWDDVVPDSALATLFVYSSPPLRDILPFFLKPSQNQIGELLLKTIGLARTGVGTADSGAAVAGRVLRSWGIDSMAFVIRDGSGLSRHNLLAPATLVGVLDVMRRDSLATLFRDALPAPGEAGTLERRMLNTAAAAAVRAKTGSMDRVRAISGYVTTRDGRPLIFSLIINAYPTSSQEIEGVMDRIIVALAELQMAS
jgi:D-alanyl-D-alanine carboxypeptidase/D-alanyl-D-alanine-endopeptidase (penicillin-binding protein 4)